MIQQPSRNRVITSRCRAPTGSEMAENFLNRCCDVRLLSYLPASLARATFMSRPDTASTVIHQTVRIDESLPAPCASSASSITSEKNRNHRNASGTSVDNDKKGWTEVFKRPWKLPQALQWIPANFTWEKLKPVIRCALAGWISVVVFVIPRVNTYMGQVSVCLCRSCSSALINFPYVALHIGFVSDHNWCVSYFF